jgi:predicted NBD/HSP70 family sugar kinase
VSNLIAELESEGLVARGGRRRAARGQPPVVYTVNPGGAAAVGFEVRPDALVMVVTDLAGTVLTARQVALDGTAPGMVFDQMAWLLAQAPPLPRLLGAGLVIPGPFGVEGLSSAGATVLPDWDGVPAETLAAERLGMRVVLEKDATAAAIAEGLTGAAQGLDSFACLYFGSGLGLGIIAKGQPLRGAFGNAGEIGHVVVRPGGLPCDCRNRGCLEQYASRMALTRHLAGRGLIGADERSDADRVDAVVTSLLSKGDAGLSGWIDQAAEALSQAVGMLENLFDPQTVILSGVLPDALLDALCARLVLPPGSVARRVGRSLPRVSRGSAGRMTAALGGAALVIHDAVTPRLDNTTLDEAPT